MTAVKNGNFYSRFLLLALQIWKKSEFFFNY